MQYSIKLIVDYIINKETIFGREVGKGMAEIWRAREKEGG